MRILGIDPGTRVVGFGLVQCRKSQSINPRDYSILDAGVVKADVKLSQASRLGAIHQEIFKLAEHWQPQLCVIEGAFFGRNARSALMLGQARGALIAAMARVNVPVEEIAPTKVKMVMTGRGQSEKLEVAKAVERLLRFQLGLLPFDVSDALAIALSFCLSRVERT